MKHYSFTWSLDGTHCSWSGYDLCVDSAGTWIVLLGHHRVATHKEQTKGMNLEDAQRRAQAAAMIHHQLRNTKQ